MSGLTRGSLRDVEALPAGSPIFLFNVNDKRLHGVFESVRSHGPGLSLLRGGGPAHSHPTRDPSLSALLLTPPPPGGLGRPEPGARGVD